MPVLSERKRMSWGLLPKESTCPGFHQFGLIKIQEHLYDRRGGRKKPRETEGKQIDESGTPKKINDFSVGAE